MRALHFALLATPLTLLACGSSDNNTNPTTSDSGVGADANDGAVSDTNVSDAAPPSPFSIPCTDTIDSIYTAPTNLPAFDPSHRGDVVRCAFDRTLSSADVDALAAKASFKSVSPAPSAVNLWRITYRTTRPGDKEALGTGWIMVPSTPLSGAQPLIIGAHGTVGAAKACTESKNTNLADDDVLMSIEIAAHGYWVVAPDYAGSEFNQPPPGYLFSGDEARSMLDGSRALRAIAPKDAMTDTVLAVGHSQGGHVVLSTQALAKTYGAGGTLKGVLAFAPPWFTAKTYGAILSPIVALNTKDNGGAIAYATLYFWTHGEILDGPGGGVAMIQASKRDQLNTILSTKCDLAPEMAALGNTPSDFYDPSFVDSVGTSCSIGDTCDAEPAKTWHQRFKDDRPTIDTASGSIVIWEGSNDTTVPPERVACGIDKIKADLAADASATTKLTVCGETGADHGGVVKDNMGWAVQWIAAMASGTDLPTCATWDSTINKTCATPPSNTD